MRSGFRAAIVSGCFIIAFAAPYSDAGGDKKSNAFAKKIATLEEIELHLAKGAVGQKGDRASHIAWFASVYPPDDDTKAKVARKLIELTKDNSNAVVRGRAGAALPNWATAEIGPQLIDLINGTGPTEKEGAIIACGRIKYEKAIPRLVREISSGNRHALAADALIEIGAPAEEKVAALFEKNLPHCNRFACQILEKIGTRKSIPVLEQAAAKINDRSQKERCLGAIESINEREKVK